MKIEIEVTSCESCPYKGVTKDMGSTWVSCNHKDIKFMNELERGVVPSWCPLGLGNKTDGLSSER